MPHILEAFYTRKAYPTKSQGLYLTEDSKASNFHGFKVICRMNSKFSTAKPKISPGQSCQDPFRLPRYHLTCYCTKKASTATQPEEKKKQLKKHSKKNETLMTMNILGLKIGETYNLIISQSS